MLQLAKTVSKIGTGSDSGYRLAKLSLIMFEHMVCEGTVDSGGNTCALEFILLIVNETGDTEDCNCKRLALPY